jgi:hypothetical protein
VPLTKTGARHETKREKTNARRKRDDFTLRIYPTTPQKFEPNFLTFSAPTNEIHDTKIKDRGSVSRSNGQIAQLAKIFKKFGEIPAIAAHSPPQNPNGVPSLSPAVAESARLPWVFAPC